MENQQSTSMCCFMLADSHGKSIPPTLFTPTYKLITRSIPGLKWIDIYDSKLSVFALLSLAEIQSSVSQANSILFLVGTNSVRVLPANQVISQVERLISFVQQTFPHLHQSGKISIVLTLPCFKITRRFRTEQSLLSNINLYNEELKLLSSKMNFNIVDFSVSCTHLANDNMHIHFSVRHHIMNSILNHFDQVINSLITTTTSTTSEVTPSPPILSSTSTSDEEQSCKKSKSRAVLDRKNKKRFEQLKLKRQQHTIKRKIHYQWTAALIKIYLQSLQVKFSRIPPVHNRVLRIVFNNQHEEDLAVEQLGIDVFDEKHFEDFINKNH